MSTLLEAFARAYARIPRSLKRFAVTGALAVAIDGLVYTLLLTLGAPVNWSKAIGFSAGTAFAYFANRFWTFGETRTQQSRALPFVALYFASATLNVGLNHLLLGLFGASELALFVCWFAATGASATLNYLGMRFFVFERA